MPRVYAGVAQLVEQLICNQPVVGSNPIASSSLKALLLKSSGLFLKNNLATYLQNYSWTSLVSVLPSFLVSKIA